MLWMVLIIIMQKKKKSNTKCCLHVNTLPVAVSWSETYWSQRKKPPMSSVLFGSDTGLYSGCPNPVRIRPEQIQSSASVLTCYTHISAMSMSAWHSLEQTLALHTSHSIVLVLTHDSSGNAQTQLSNHNAELNTSTISSWGFGLD